MERTGQEWAILAVDRSVKGLRAHGTEVSEDAIQRVKAALTETPEAYALTISVITTLFGYRPEMKRTVDFISSTIDPVEAEEEVKAVA